MPHRVEFLSRHPLTGSPPDEDGGPGLPPPRFGMRGLMVAMTVLCVLLWFMAAAGAWASLVLVLIASLVSMHVAGNALGTRLRDGTTASLARRTAKGSATMAHQRPLPDDGLDASRAGPPVRSPAPARPADAARATRRGYQNRLRHRAPLGRVHYFWGGLGALAAGMLACVCLAALLWTRLSVAAWLLGTMSVALLGGMVGFLGSCLCYVVRQAVRDAMGDCGRST